MTHYAESELLNELINIQEQIELCFDQKNWSQVMILDSCCCDCLEKVNEFAKTGASVMLKLQVDSLIKSYRDLLTRSIFEQKILSDKQDDLTELQSHIGQLNNHCEPQYSVQ